MSEPLPPAVAAATLEYLYPSVETRAARWKREARPEQLPPDWPWDIWFVRAGRGWGKSRLGAEWAAGKARDYPGCRIALVAQSFADGRDTMVEGESGLLSVLDDRELRGGDRDGAWNRSLGELFLASGSRFKLFTSERSRQLRGPQHHFAWGDEPATWHDAYKGPAEDTTFSNLQFGLRLTLNGSSPQLLLTGTPRPVKLLTERTGPPKGLLHREGVAVTTGHTDDNLENLAPAYRAAVIDPYRGTRLGRQELAGEVLEDVPGALVKRQWIEDGRGPAVDPGQIHARAIGLDPGGIRAQALCTVARRADGMLFVEHAETYDPTPADLQAVGDVGSSAASGYLKHAIRLGQAGAVTLPLGAPGATIVVEKNHGGDFLMGLLYTWMQTLGVIVPVQPVTASVGKRARLEPVATLAEQGRIRWPAVSSQGVAELEDQLCSWDGSGESPHLLDAFVWAATHLMGGVGLGEREPAVPWA